MSRRVADEVFGEWGGWILGVLIAVVLPLLLRAPARVNLLTEVMILGLFATAYNLVLGYGGLVSFGHAAFFGLGAYITAIFLVKFSLPLWAVFIVAPIVGGLVGAIFGFFAARAAHLFVGFLTLAFAQMIWAVFYSFPLIGGVDGIWSVPIGEAFYSPITFYYFTVGIAAVCFLLLHFIVRSPFGLVLQSIRDNRMRSEFVGLNYKRYRIAVFAISAFFSSIAGVLYCMLNRGAYPELLYWATTGNALLTTLLGGMYSFFGPLLGAGIMVVLGDFFIRKTMYWPLVMGIMVILLVLLLPGGIAEWVGKIWTYWTTASYKRLRRSNDVA